MRTDVLVHKVKKKKTAQVKKYETLIYYISGPQVVGNMAPDINSYWRILPGGFSSDDNAKQYVQHNDIIRLEHIATGRLLMTHDVAAPWTPTNHEITTTNDPVMHENTLFKLVLNDLTSGPVWSTFSKSLNLVHVKSNVDVLCTTRNLPEWGQFHLEINGKKNGPDKANQWVATDILGFNGKFLYFVQIHGFNFFFFF